MIRQCTSRAKDSTQVTTKKKQIDEQEVPLLKSEHFSINTRDGFSSVSRISKTFYIPDDEMVELHELLTTWRKEHDTNFR